MKQVINAIYEKGVFKPATVPKLSEGQPVRLVVETIPEEADILTLAGQVYEGLSEQDIREIEEIALDRKSFFLDRKE